MKLNALPAFAMLLGAFAGPAAAQDYPTKPIQMIVPFAPGGNTDLMARALQPELTKALGQQIVVLNKGGAAGTLGNVELSQARPDGYTIGLSPNNALTAQIHLQKLPYSLDSFRFVCLTYNNPQVLIAGPQAPFKTFTEFAAFAKSKSDALIYGSPGPGSTPHLIMLDLLDELGVKSAVHVPFSGTGPMAQALLGGTVMAFSESPAIAKASNLPVLASFSNERLPALPDVPTLRELGHDVEGFSAGGIVVPARTPDAVVAKLEKACAEATSAPAYKAGMGKLNAVDRYLPGAEFKQMFEQDSRRNAQAVRDAGLAKN